MALTASNSRPPKLPNWLAITLAATAVVVPRFVALALLGSLRGYPRGLPGFWDYPSGTIGDAFLVPGDDRRAGVEPATFGL